MMNMFLSPPLYSKLTTFPTDYVNVVFLVSIYTILLKLSKYQSSAHYVATRIEIIRMLCQNVKGREKWDSCYLPLCKLPLKKYTVCFRFLPFFTLLFLHLMNYFVTKSKKGVL